MFLQISINCLLRKNSKLSNMHRQGNISRAVTIALKKLTAVTAYATTARLHCGRWHLTVDAYYA